MAADPQQSPQSPAEAECNLPHLTLMKSPSAMPLQATPAVTESLGDSLDEPLGDFTDSSIGEVASSPIESPIRQSVNSPIQSPNGSTHPPIPILSNLSDTAATAPLAHANATSSPVILTDNQAILLACLKQINGEITSLKHISRATGVSEHTLKSGLKKLINTELIQYGGRRSCGGRFGFTATVTDRPIELRGNPDGLRQRLQRVHYRDLMMATPLPQTALAISPLPPTQDPLNLPLEDLGNHLMDHLMEPPSCSSSYRKQLQELQRYLLLEDAFGGLKLRSLLPYVDQFDSFEELQTFLDMANACITAGKAGAGKLIKNPQGFLFAQLKAGFINPPEGFKSRRVQAQEHRNAQLRAELATLRRLQQEEQELCFELFQEKLSEEESRQVREQAETRIKPGLGLSRERQLEISQHEVMREWYAQRVHRANESDAESTAELGR